MQRVVILGAGFGGLELATTLSEAVGDDFDIALIDQNDAFVFGYSKLDVMFGRTTADAVRLAYRDIAKPGVRFLQQTITAIDPEARSVTTDGGVHEADFLVVGLGADYDLDATPGLAERDIEFVPGRRVSSLDPARRVVLLEDGSELPYDLFLGVPKHRAPDVVVASGMTEDGYVPVDPKTLETRFPGVYAVGDVATIGVPKAGMFAEGAARVVAAALIARLQGGEQPGPYGGRGSCYIEFGAGRVGRVDVDFLSGPKPTGTFQEPADALVAEKQHFGSSRPARRVSR